MADPISTPLNLISQLFSNVNSQSVHEWTSGSLIEYTKPTRIEPITLVDRRCTNLPYIDEVLHTALNLFSGYYLQAVQLSMGISGVNVLKELEKFSPERTNLLSRESAQLDSENPYAFPFPQDSSLSVEEDGEFDQGQQNGDSSQNTKSSRDYKGVSGGSVDATQVLNQDANLAVGKLLEINANMQEEVTTPAKNDGEEPTSKTESTEVKFKVMVRLAASTISSSALVDAISLDADMADKTWDRIRERWHGWRSGQLRFVKDIILAQDLIERHRRNMLDDESGYYQRMHERDRNNKIASLITKTPSIGTASSIFIMDANTARELEKRIRGELSRFRVREKIFKQTGSMLMLIIDPDWEVVTIYHRSINEPTEASVREIQRAVSKGGKGGPDIMEILNALRQSQSPTI